MTLSQADFFARYRELDTESLLRLVATRELTDEAREAARLVLIERDVTGERFELEYQNAVRGILRSSGATNQCDYCGSSIALGAYEADGQRFCSVRCRDDARVHEVALSLAPDLVQQHAQATFTGSCPLCARRGKPIEIRPRWLVVSIIVNVAIETEYALCCRRCAHRKNGWAALTCLLFGWWSLPGLLVTPAAIYRNIAAIYVRRVLAGPSPRLLEWAAFDLARRVGDPMRQAASIGSAAAALDPQH